MILSLSDFDAARCAALHAALTGALARRVPDDTLRRVPQLHGGRVAANGVTCALTASGLMGTGTSVADACRAWAEEAEGALAQADLRAFLARHHAAPLDALRDALRDACRRGDGFWMEPGQGSRPATHLYEIAAFGLTGVGWDALQAADAWRRAALLTVVAAAEEAA